MNIVAPKSNVGPVYELATPAYVRHMLQLPVVNVALAPSELNQPWTPVVPAANSANMPTKVAAIATITAIATTLKPSFGLKTLMAMRTTKTSAAMRNCPVRLAPGILHGNAY